MKHILLVEDNLFYGSLITHALTARTPYIITHVQTAQSALDTCHNLVPALFLLDYDLPDKNGLELFDQLHAIPALVEVPAILISAALPDPSIEEALQQRNIPGLCKPFSFTALLTMMKGISLPIEL